MSRVSTFTPPPSPGSFYLSPGSNSPRKSPADRSPAPKFTSESEAIEHERLVKSQLKQFKRLEFALGKFTSKLNGIMKTNMLRTILLPFLRLLLPLDRVFSDKLLIYSSFVSVSITILGRWWRLLLSALTTANLTQQVSSTDRNAYLECISRIMCRKEWFLAGPEGMVTYTSCLCETLDYAISKISAMKIIPISMSAFFGKTFAYAYFYIPGVSNALLFLLNIKQSTMEACLSKAPTISPEELQASKEAFPRHLSFLIGYTGLPNLDRFKKKTLNCVPPPRHPVRGICEPNGTWVRSWSCCDSDIFNSFFRHWVTVCSSCVGEKSVPLESFPGFNVILCNFYQIFNVCVNKISLDTASNGSFKKFSMAKVNGSSNSPFIASGASSRPMDPNYAALIKLFKTIRDVGYSEASCSAEVVRAVDRVLIRLAAATSIYDFGKSATILNLVCEFSNYVADPTDLDWEFWLGCTYLTLSKTNLIQSITMSFAFLFNVWNMIPSQISQSVQPQEELYLAGWLNTPSESYKENFAKWLTCNEIWLQFFVHWNPLVRAYYMRLISWRVIGFNNYESSVSILTTHRIKSKVEVIYMFLMRIFRAPALPQRFQSLDFSADLPMVNRKLSIVPINSTRCSAEIVPSLPAASNTPKSSSDLRKSHPYEILDEAVYTCNLLSTSALKEEKLERGGKSVRNHSLISSFGKIFKLLSTDDSDDNLLSLPPPGIGPDRAEPANSIACGRKSKSFNSFLTGTLSLKSGSSSPSLRSFQPSLNDALTDLPATSDSETSSSLSSYLGSSSTSTLSSQTSVNNNPPEFVKHTPDIVRPVYKFEVVLDNELIAMKVSLMQNANAHNDSTFFGCHRSRGLALRTLPTSPRIPSTSIFLNSDRYSKFYVTKEDFDFADVVSCDDEKAPTIEDMFKQIKTPTELAALGRALNEWNRIVDEFETFLAHTVEADQAHSLGEIDGVDVDEGEYHKRIVPFMPIDNFIELKLLNAL